MSVDRVRVHDAELHCEADSAPADPGGCGLEPNSIGVFSRGIARIPNLRAFLDHPIVLNPKPRDPRIRAAAGWGRKPSGERARHYAARRGIPCLQCEDGFLRSVGLGLHGAAPLSLVVDDLGIYFDATRPSRLERLLNEAELTQEQLSRAERLLETLMTHNLSKYNHVPDARPDLVPDRGRARVLLIDQTANDQSIRFGLASPSTFRAMVDAAAVENPGADLYIKSHPDVIAGKRDSALAFARELPRFRWIAEGVSPHSLLRRFDRVYTVSSQMGFEALMLGKAVSCFGLPFYAGWGLTDDRLACSRRVRRRSLLELLAVAYILYPRYLDPVTGRRCEVERVAEHLALQRRRFAETQGRIFAFGFDFWKRAHVRSFVASPWNSVQFVRGAGQAKARGFDRNSRILVWASRESEEIRRMARDFGVPVWRMEDGFIRSAGLGSDFVRPYSLVVDRSGIYFDPSAASDLETLLNRANFPEELIRRARKLRRRICSARITKYNVEGDGPITLDSGGRTVLLVPGQVEDDASIIRGGSAIRTNEALLRAVRERNPDAYLLFKPHPDVLARNRAGSQAMKVCNRLCDHVETRHSILSCLEAAQVVHTLTSLSGFDALLRGKRVVTYGSPFYAGWGLTEDLGAPVPRRERRLSLDELVAGTLLAYPRYWDPRSASFVELEDVLARILEEKRSASRLPTFPLAHPRRKILKWMTFAHAVLSGLR